MTAYDTIHRAILDGVADRDVPRWAAGVVGEVASGGSGIMAVRHPLGFYCLPVERTGERGVCVHLWSDRLTPARPTTSATHAHSWELVSFVLCGTLCNELVTVKDSPVSPVSPDSPDGPTHRVFEVISTADGDEIRRTPRLVRRRTRAAELHHSGEVYSLPAGVFHETTHRGETATVALGRGFPDAVDLVLGAPDTETHRTRRHVCGRDETIHAASLVVDLLAEVPRPRHEEHDRCERRRP